MTRERFERGATFREHLDRVERNRELWHGLWERVRLPEAVVEAARALPSDTRLLVLSEDWCGDAVNTLPVVARLAEEIGWDLRIVSRDDNPDLMEAHLTNGRARSIPVVIAYDADFREVGWWGPRPSELQAWVLDQGLAMPSPERYKIVRGWYARDRGQSTLTELLDVIRQAA